MISKIALSSIEVWSKFNKLIYIYDVYLFVLLLLFFRLRRKVVEFLGFLPTQVSSIFSRLSRVFCRGFSWPPSVSCRYASKKCVNFPWCHSCDVFVTVLFIRLRWSSIKRSGLLVICVLLGSLLLRTEWLFLYCLQLIIMLKVIKCINIRGLEKKLMGLIIHSKYFHNSDWLKAQV